MACADGLFEPESIQRHGCLQTKGAVYIVPEKSCARLLWTFRGRSGSPVDFSDCLPGDADDSPLSVSASESIVPASRELKARFMVPDDHAELYETSVHVQDPEIGQLEVPVPWSVLDSPAIWSVQVGIIHKASGRLLDIDRGLLSVERTLWGDPHRPVQRGPLTLDQIRTFLRDRAPENELLLEHEFDAVEILDAMLRPLRQWNETPPAVAFYTSRNFPWPQHWLEATVGCLLETAGHWYARNKHSTVAAGLRLLDREKDQLYLQLAADYRLRWTQFMMHQKVALNVRMGWAKISHPNVPGVSGDW